MQKSLIINARLLSTDALGNIYVVKNDNTLIRLNAQGDSTAAFNEIKKGKITQIDATNPLRILLFLGNYKQIVILNNMLTQRNVIRLDLAGFPNIACIANSADGLIWLYDPVNGSLMKSDEKLNIVQSADLRNINQNPKSPIFMIENERELFIADSLEGVRKYDQFGFYKSGFPFKPIRMQFFNDYLVYFSTPSLVSFQMKSFVEKKLNLPDPDSIIDVRIERNNIYILRNQQLDIYELVER